MLTRILYKQRQEWSHSLPHWCSACWLRLPKNKFDTSNQQVEQFAASLMLLNRELVNYGPEANDTEGSASQICGRQDCTDLAGRTLDLSRDLAIPRLGSCLRVFSRV